MSGLIGIARKLVVLSEAFPRRTRSDLNGFHPAQFNTQDGSIRSIKQIRDDIPPLATRILKTPDVHSSYTGRIRAGLANLPRLSAAKLASLQLEVWGFNQIHSPLVQPLNQLLSGVTREFPHNTDSCAILEGEFLQSVRQMLGFVPQGLPEIILTSAAQTWAGVFNSLPFSKDEMNDGIRKAAQLLTLPLILNAAIANAAGYSQLLEGTHHPDLVDSQSLLWVFGASHAINTPFLTQARMQYLAATTAARRNKTIHRQIMASDAWTRHFLSLLNGFLSHYCYDVAAVLEIQNDYDGFWEWATKFVRSSVLSRAISVSEFAYLAVQGFFKSNKQDFAEYVQHLIEFSEKFQRMVLSKMNSSNEGEVLIITSDNSLSLRQEQIRQKTDHKLDIEESIALFLEDVENGRIG
ncbi:MAG: hypothetical protein ABIE74_07735 [Pseudomonadota bacterium]